MKQADLIVSHAHIITMDPQRRILDDAAIVVVDGRITAMGSSEEILSQWQATECMDVTNKAVFPGFINTHDHQFQVLLKGLGRDKKLLDWLDNSVRRSLKAATTDRIRAAAITGCLDSLRSGCTTLMDFHYPHGYPDTDQAILDAFEQTGIRGVLARSQVTNAGCAPGYAPAYEETEDDFIAAVEKLDDKYRDHPRISIAIAPSIIWEISKEGLQRVQKLAHERNMVVTMHLLETADDDAYTQKVYGKSEMELLEEIGFLGSNLVAVHCVLATDETIQLFAKYGVKVAHCPLANMILASGVAPVPAFQKAGLTVSLATDGSASSDTHDMLEVLKATALIHKCVHRDPALIGAEDVLEMATLGGARCLNMEHEIGSLEVGKRADFFVFNPRTVKAAACADPIATLVYSSSQQNIETTVVDGRVLLKNGVFTQIDELVAVDTCHNAAASLRRETGLGNTHWGQRVVVEEFR